MLRGELVGLRARVEADVAILHAAFHDDISSWSRTNTKPWTPIPADLADSPFALGGRGEDVAAFSVVTLADDQLVGSALLWGIDTHSRIAHLGISLLPELQGQGLGIDTVRLLCRYGFAVRGFRRLQLETLADNAAMIATAKSAGFVHEGTLREAAYVEGQILDEVIYGLLAGDWSPGVA
jgi:RimJ/RimL family protein N-acetyltransferase